MNAWPPQASYPCGLAFAVPVRTEHRDQTSFCPFALREVSVLTELVLGHLRYSLIDLGPSAGCRVDYDPERFSLSHGDTATRTPISTLGARTTAVPRVLKPEGGAPRPTEALAEITLRQQPLGPSQCFVLIRQSDSPGRSAGTGIDLALRLDLTQARHPTQEPTASLTSPTHLEPQSNPYPEVTDPNFADFPYLHYSID
ncbi:hypothetical protein PGT21_000037 [Puccinia graminis f. sp. tritici]|uniref:Uncharacterized protein n=1 Tax=Puccinia graminis f. sp. tritici TaxID=56615 RepID=A0A5B0MY44_PUCGR|nr:hypothetical protein PGT21_000037 [Puccinia graminis f. sp. tritici]